MGFSNWLSGVRGDAQKTKSTSVYVKAAILTEAAQEYIVRNLAFETCVNIIANAIGKCEFKTYKNHEEFKGREYYLWNIEPNPNQNSTAFLHKLVYQLYKTNEALIVGMKNNDGTEILAVADSFSASPEYPKKPQEYSGITVGDFTFNKTFAEHEVLHLKLNSKDMKAVLDGLNASCEALLSSAMDNYNWGNGQHLKVHIEQLAQGGYIDADGEEKDWNTVFSEMMEKQVLPFLKSKNGILPEFDGYKYEKMGGSPDANRSTRDIRAVMDDIFNFTARGFCIPPVLLLGDVAGTKDAMTRWLTTCIDPLVHQIEEEANRKRYGFDEWSNGNYMTVDTSALIHFDMFENAANIEKLVGSGTYTINDIRRATGREEIAEDWANAHYMTLNIVGIEEAAKPLEVNENEN